MKRIVCLCIDSLSTATTDIVLCICRFNTQQGHLVWTMHDWNL